MIPPRPPSLPEAPAPGGLLLANLVHFANVLRRAGLPVGTDAVLGAAEALTLVGLEDRDAVRAALRATAVRRHEQEELFDGAFELFWRDPAAARDAAMAAALAGGTPEKPAPGNRRLAEAMGGREREADRPPERDAALGASESEQLDAMDFEQMSAAEVEAARAAIRRLSLPLDRRRTRRLRPDPAGSRVDLPATLRRSLREGGDLLGLEKRARVVRPPPLVALCDISGSMARYAPVLLHFLHALANSRPRVHVFLFGTRLSNVSRLLTHRDAEVAFQMVSAAVPDWSGGTRIGDTIDRFNRDWGKRVLGQGATVLLMTDGLDRGAPDGLGAAMERLHRSSRRLIWLNPLLRWAGFQPKSQGIRAMLPHVDDFRTIHNLDSMKALVDILSRPAQPSRRWSLDP